MNLVGIVENIIFKNPENGYTVAEVETKDGAVVIVGIMPLIGEGEQIEVIGDYTTHATYGTQFAVTGFESRLPPDETSIFRYLSSGVVKGVRASTAKNLINAFGPETLEILENEPEKVSKIKGITLDRAMKISESIKANSGIKSILIHFQQFGMTLTTAFKIYKKWGAKSYDFVRENPYCLCEIQGVGFEKADKIALQMNFDDKSLFRVKAAITYILTYNLNSNGHTFQPRNKLRDVAAELLDIDFATVDDAIDELIDENQLIYVSKIGNTDGIYLRFVYEAEQFVANRVILSSKFTSEYPGDFESDVKKAEEALEISFAQNQKAAIKNSMCNQIMVLTGGPGTGKTTTLNGIIYNFGLKGLTFALAAPTGRAAKRMTELTGKEAKTIHRLLEYGEQSGKLGFSRNLQNPLKYDAIIIDETSMVDLQLFAALLAAIPVKSRIVLVGDVNQLPPVGPGCVFKDIIMSRSVNVVELNEIFRQAKESLIVTNAHQIINGQMPECRDVKHDFFFLPVDNSVDLSMKIADLYTSRLPIAYGYDPLSDIQIICPTKKTESGTVALNTMLREVVNPYKNTKCEFKHKEIVFREGDKVMQMRNNYDLIFERDNGDSDAGVFNGDIGRIEEIREFDETIIVRFDDKRVTYSREELDDLEHAYAITVHKSQGSEWNAVILPLFEGSSLLFTRNLLYTAVTRAKKLLIIVGSSQKIRMMVENVSSDKRYCGLKQMMMEVN